MAGTFGSVEIVFDHFEKFEQVIADAADQALEKAARDIEAKAKMDAPVDTGNMKNSIYSKGPGFSTFGKDHPNDTQPEEPIGDHEAVVHAGAPYSVYVDYGTAHTPARPFFSGAVESVKPTLEAVMAKIMEAGGLS